MTEHDIIPNHYTLLRVKTTASPQEIRRAYRDLSKLYHPDTTQLLPEVATEKFQILNEAYATLSNPEKRMAYDYSIGVSRVAVIQAPEYLNRSASERNRYEKSNAYLDPTDRPLSPGELFALFILGLTFLGCLVLVVAISWTRGDLVLYTPETKTPKTETPRTEILASPESSLPTSEFTAPTILPDGEALIQPDVSSQGTYSEPATTLPPPEQIISPKALSLSGFSTKTI